jgi:hypothetical protein
MRIGDGQIWESARRSAKMPGVRVANRESRRVMGEGARRNVRRHILSQQE